MIKDGIYRFRNFTVDIKKRSVPNSYLVTFKAGTDVDQSGWESAAGDRKKFEEDFKFMWNPLDAPSNNKSEHVVKFSSKNQLKKFADWLDNEIKQYGGLKDDI